MTIFQIRFSDNDKMKFDDVIELNAEQKSTILSNARKYNQIYIVNLKEGFKVELTLDQQAKVLKEKNNITQDKTATQLYQNNVIEFTEHSIERIIKRYKGDLSRCYLFVIDMVKDSNDVSNIAEWKGRSNLTYLFLHLEERVEYKVVVSFIKGRDKMRMITAMNESDIDSMDFRISEDNDMNEKLLNLREQLKNRFKK